MSGQRSRAWESAEIHEHYTLTLDDGAVHASVALPAGLWIVEADDGDAWVSTGENVAVAPTEVNEANGGVARRVRAGGGIYVYLDPAWEVGRFIVAKRKAGSGTVVIELARVS